MPETMFASVLIISISFVLVIYWFRYSCILLLRGYAEQTTAAPATVSQNLEAGAELDAFHKA
jgi:hypothetical protein